jgi:hypothetical protein
VGIICFEIITPKKLPFIAFINKKWIYTNSFKQMGRKKIPRSVPFIVGFFGL